MDGNVFTNDVISVLVPYGWKAFPGIDSGGKVTQKKVHVYKNAQIETDVFCTAGITICYFGENDIYLPTKSFYDDVTDITPFKAGNHIWSGYTCTSLGYPYTMLEERNGKTVFQVMILTKNGDNVISLDDEDVRKILERIDSQ